MKLSSRFLLAVAVVVGFLVGDLVVAALLAGFLTAGEAGFFGGILESGLELCCTLTNRD